MPGRDQIQRVCQAPAFAETAALKGVSVHEGETGRVTNRNDCHKADET